MKNYTEIIEKYIEGELTSEELKWFEKELITNPEFAKEVDLHIKINHAIQENDVMELREKLKKIMDRGNL